MLTIKENRELRQLYQSIDDSLWNQVESYNRSEEANPNFHLTNPFLLAISQEILDCPVKVMLICKDTMSWGGEFHQNAYFVKDAVPDKLMYLYFSFVGKGGDLKFAPWKLKKEIESKFNKRVSVIVNNLHFIGYTDGRTGTFEYYDRLFDNISLVSIIKC